MLLIQLSDLHIGGNYFRQEIFGTIVYEVKNKLKPDDAILITGDLTDDGLISQFRRASIEIKKLTDVCPNVIILPGIHDYPHTGYLLFKKFFSSYSSYPSSVHRFDKTMILTLCHRQTR